MTTYPFNFRPDKFLQNAEIAGAVRLTDVAPTSIGWLWPGRIPLGRVTLLVSDPGLGKSLLTLDIAARVSRGAQWPDANDENGTTNHESSSHSSFDIRHSSLPSDAKSAVSPSPHLPLSPSSVLLLTAEDDLADTVRPRLEALGADCDKILAISSVPGENANDVPRAFALNRDLARLKILLRAIPDCRLLIIDPVSAYLGGANEQANADVQSLLTALATLARERDLAVIIVSHLRKKEGAAIHRAMGSLAFVAAARTAWTIAKDPADAARRLFLPLKNNLAPNINGLAFTIESNEANRAPVIHWLPETVEARADAVLASNRQRGRPDDERRYAIDWLRTRLSGGASRVREIRNDADAHAISYATLRRAFHVLGGEAIRLGPVPNGEWQWQLPAVDAQNSVGEF